MTGVCNKNSWLLYFVCSNSIQHTTQIVVETIHKWLKVSYSCFAQLKYLWTLNTTIFLKRTTKNSCKKVQTRTNEEMYDKPLCCQTSFYRGVRALHGTQPIGCDYQNQKLVIHRTNTDISNKCCSCYQIPAVIAINGTKVNVPYGVPWCGTCWLQLHMYVVS